MGLLATLGDFDDQKGRGYLIELNLERQSTSKVKEFCPPTHLRASGKGFTGVCWIHRNNTRMLLVSGFCALYLFSPKNWSLKGIIHQPCMNDIHHVASKDNKIYIVNTGFDRIDILSDKFQFIGGYYLEPTWISCKRFNGKSPSKNSWKEAFYLNKKGNPNKLEYIKQNNSKYYKSNRKDMKFHQKRVREFIHPNHICLIRDNILITRFIDRTIQNLKNWEIIIKDIPGYPHDGKVFDNIFWITCTNGKIIGYEMDNDIPKNKISEVIDVFSQTGHTGWLRGLCITNDLFIVGLTKIKRMPIYRWCSLPFKDTETSVLAIDRNSKKLVSHISLSKFGSHPKIFDLIEI